MSSSLPALTESHKHLHCPGTFPHVGEKLMDRYNPTCILVGVPDGLMSATEFYEIIPVIENATLAIDLDYCALPREQDVNPEVRSAMRRIITDLSSPLYPMRQHEFPLVADSDELRQEVWHIAELSRTHTCPIVVFLPQEAFTRFTGMERARGQTGPRVTLCTYSYDANDQFPRFQIIQA